MNDRRVNLRTGDDCGVSLKAKCVFQIFVIFASCLVRAGERSARVW